MKPKIKRIKKTEPIFYNERVDIYKINDSPEARRELEFIEAGEGDKLEKLSYFHSTKKNIIPLEAREKICKLFTGEDITLEEFYLNISALGTSAAVPTENSTKLTNEVFRKFIQSRSRDKNTIFVMSRYLPEDCSGSFREEAVFLQGDLEVKDSGCPLSIINLTATEGDKTDREYLIIERKFILKI